MKIVIGQGSCGIAAGAEKVRRALLNTDINAESADKAGKGQRNRRAGDCGFCQQRRQKRR